MSALAIARRVLAEMAERDARAKHPDAGNESDAVSPAATPAAEPSRVNLVSRVPPSEPEPREPPAETSRVTFVSFVDAVPESAPRSALAGLSDCLLAALKSQAAAGDADAARQAVALADYWAACDRGEVVLAETPGSIAAREWNRMIDERDREKLAGKPTRLKSGR